MTRALAAALALTASPAAAGLKVTDLGKSYKPDDARVPIRQTEANPGGNTSVRNTGRENLEWKSKGYYQRNRDLGQVFTPGQDFTLDAIVLRTGPSDGAVLHGAPGAKVFVQFFRVAGEPRVNDNGTPPGTDAKHGFSTNHRCDDYLTGVRFEPIRVVKGGVFPDLPPTRDSVGRANGTRDGNYRYMRWEFTGEDRLTFQAGHRYAFMVGFEEPANERGFTLANANRASVTDPPALNDRHDTYPGGWGLRREGDGTTPPTMRPGDAPPPDAAANEKLIGESLFGEGEARYALPPVTEGYPDVDTYRDLEFYMEVSPAGGRP